MAENTFLGQPRLILKWRGLERQYRSVNGAMTNLGEALYGDAVVQVEPYGAQVVPDAERHGRPGGQFTLWLGSNLTIADYALGFFPIELRMPWTWTIAAILVGNILGGVAMALCAGLGPEYGAPQLIISRLVFGRRGGYAPALLNYVSTIGWFSVNNILGAFGLKVLWPHLQFWQAAVLLVVVQGVVAVFGYNLIHWYERIMSVVLGLMFLGVTVMAVAKPAKLAAYHPVAHNPWVLFAIMVAAAFSYIGSWGPYAADYSRYLPTSTRRFPVIAWSFLGAFIASVWLELVGALVGVLAGASANPIAALHRVTGGLGDISVVAIILGGTAADALNIYSNSLSAGALDIKIPRWMLAVVASFIGLGLSIAGSGAFEAYYDNFLLLLGYWMTPWMGVMFAALYLKHISGFRPDAVQWRGLISFLVGLAVSIPFMNSTLFEGPVAKSLGGADLTFYVGFLVAFFLYWLWPSSKSEPSPGALTSLD